jgi:hypothetical protein
MVTKNILLQPYPFAEKVSNTDQQDFSTFGISHSSFTILRNAHSACDFHPILN